MYLIAWKLLKTSSFAWWFVVRKFSDNRVRLRYATEKRYLLLNFMCTHELLIDLILFYHSFLHNDNYIEYIVLTGYIICKHFFHLNCKWYAIFCNFLKYVSCKSIENKEPLIYHAALYDLNEHNLHVYVNAKQELA